LVNTPDIYEENKYQRRNLLLYHRFLNGSGEVLKKTTGGIPPLNSEVKLAKINNKPRGS
jgi:hypothetical protein